MTILYVVTNLVGGFAREDSPSAAVVGVYTDSELANKVKRMSGYGASVSEVEVDHIWMGHIITARELGMPFSDEQLQRKTQAEG